CRNAAEFEGEGTRIWPGSELDWVFENAEAEMDNGWGEALTNLFTLLGASAGYFIAGVLNYVIIENADKYFEDKTIPFLAYLAAVIFSLAALYTNVKLVAPSIASVVRAICNVLRNAPHNWIYLYLNR